MSAPSNSWDHPEIRELIQLALREDINRLQAVTEFFDIALVPILVAIVAVIIGWVRFRRRKRQARSVAAV